MVYGHTLAALGIGDGYAPGAPKSGGLTVFLQQ